MFVPPGTIVDLPCPPKKSEFAFAYTQLMDGEKDPRNLLMALKTARLVAANFPLDDALTQEIFDVVSCYFPITFTPPPNDPFNVSPDDLREELWYPFQ